MQVNGLIDERVVFDVTRGNVPVAAVNVHIRLRVKLVNGIFSDICCKKYSFRHHR